MDKIKNGNTFKVEHCSFDENLICGTNKAKYLRFSEDKLEVFKDLNT